MGRERINRTITFEDVKVFNETLPEVIEIYSTKNQKIEVLSELNPNIKIRIIGDKLEEEIGNEIYSSDRYYSPAQVCSIMKVLSEYEKGLDKHPNWNNLEKALYIYSRFALGYIPTQNPDDNSSSLMSLLTLNPDSKGFASFYKEAMDRLGIPCRYIENSDHSRAWNEIMINGRYYPVDLEMDSRESHLKEDGSIFVHNFAKNKEFYYLPEHKTTLSSQEDSKEVNTLDPELVQTALDTVVKQINLDQQELLEIVESEKIKLESKELSGVFNNDTVSLLEARTVENVKIKLTDDNFDNLKRDLRQISIHYPELLNNIELENTTSSKVNMQEVVDYVYSVRFPKVKSAKLEETPISITISSNLEEDFDLDFSRVPGPAYNHETPFDGVASGQKIAFKNLSQTSSIKIPKLGGKLSPNIDGISLEGFDLSNLDLTGTNVKELVLKSERTKNVSSIVGAQILDGITVNALSDTELTAALTNFAIHDLKILNQNLHDRAILQELSANPNLAKITIRNSSLNNLDGLEQFNNRLAFLALWTNDLTVNDLKRLNNFRGGNPYISMYLNANQNIENAIDRAPRISDESYNIIKEKFLISGMTKVSIDKTDAVDRLLWDSFDIPYYINDAEIIRQRLNITHNPMMVKDDNQLDNFDFTQSYLSDGTLLLTIHQIERLLQTGKVVPQNIRIKLDDVTELTSNELISLYNRMNAAGMNIVGVQLFDKKQQNHNTQMVPYSISQYIYIRDTLDMLIDGIDPSDSDIDKFATIYQRLSDFITYDHDAIKSDNATEALYNAQKRNSSRNLLEGLEEGKCVCAGYADILKNALLLVGIEARINSGLCDSTNPETAHAWNQVEIDDGTGKKWYYTDLTWDAGKSNRWTLLGANNTDFKNSHQSTKTLNSETVTPDDFDRTMLKDAFDRAKKKSFDFMKSSLTIDIPEDPNISIRILDQTRIAEEYKRRKNDMLAKFYGDRDYRKEFTERNDRYKEHEIEITRNGITYRTIEDYAEKKDDEQFLLLDKYKECLERMTRYEAGDTSVYQGTSDQIKAALEKDKEYVETRNHTFDQHKNTQRDLATLGKFGERVPYIPVQPGIIRNIGRIVLNTGIFARNAVSPIYRGIGKYVAQPIHRVITRGKDASPYRNNWYHRMVARRDYFEETNNTKNPGHTLRNGIKSRFDAVFKAQEGNRAVLRAGAADIQDNIVNQERERALIENLKARVTAFEDQINKLQEQITLRPYAKNISDVRNALKNKISEKDKLNNLINEYQKNTSGDIQTDAIDDRQHAIASKEVNTMRVTAIKGVAKGLAVRYVGPKIHSWLAERGKVTRPTQVTTSVPETKQRWVGPTYKEETVPVYSDVIDSSKNMEDIMSINGGKEITGFYSVYGGERGASTYTLTGNEKITAIFQAQGKGGTGLSDKFGLTAPTLTNGTFSSELLDSRGILNQNTTLSQLVEGLNSGNIDTSTFEDLYVSVGDRYWTKLSDLLGDVTTKVQVGEEVKKVIDVAGHYENYTEMIEKVINTTEVVTNPAFVRTANIAANLGIGAVTADSVANLAENLRATTTNTKRNKKAPRQYSFSTDVDIPTTKRAYRRHIENESR